MKYTHERNFGCRINDELTYRGLRMMVIQNELIRVSILLDKGTDIFEFVHKPTDTDFMWRSPRGVRSKTNAHVMVPHANGPFSDFYEGGWQEILPNGGRRCEYRGCEMGQHGEVWGVPWQHQILEDTPEVCSVKLWVRTDRNPYLLEKTLTVRTGSPVLEIDESVTNESDQDLDMIWGHHPAFGPPFLSEHCVVSSGAQTVAVDPNVPEDGRFEPEQEFDWPTGTARDGSEVDVRKILAPEDELEDMLYLTDFADGWYAVTNQEKKVGFGMAFDAEVFEHIWYWISLCGNPDWPSWGQFYVIALEPFSSYPAILTECMKANRQLKIGGGQTISTWMRAVAYEGYMDVTGISPVGEVTGVEG